ncbi:2681_t:CDS:2 [Diversispora eburnea]|uniref:2681_t:CDS:1 n=1 Tax=Diversispora eburnea TaxID=1213867 RepID=A0A9N9A469_9GLOM|nr:2681_t:CDS:2 [Diversispora eburnea]
MSSRLFNVTTSLSFFYISYFGFSIALSNFELQPSPPRLSSLLVSEDNYNCVQAEIAYLTYEDSTDMSLGKKIRSRELKNLTISSSFFDKSNNKNNSTYEDYWIHLLKEASNERKPPKEALNENQKAYDFLNIIDLRWNVLAMKRLG